MNDPGRSGGNGALARAGQRVFPLFVFVVVAGLIWLAHSGRYDAEVDRVAAWLHRHWDALRRH